MNAIDALAITMLAVFFMSFGVVAMLFFHMARNASRRDTEIEELMREALAEGESTPPPAPAKTHPGEAWEREGDWWRKGE